MSDTPTGAPQTVYPIAPPSTDYVAKLPIQQWNFHDCPAIPYWADAVGDPDLAQIENTVALLKQRAGQGEPGYCGLDTMYTIDGQKYSAYTFMYGTAMPADCNSTAPAPPAGTMIPPLPLDDLSQFTLSWTTYQDVYKDSQDLVAPFVKTLTDKKAASEAFWQELSEFGLPFNLLVLEKLDSDSLGALTTRFGDDIDDETQGLLAAGLVYAIDMTILETIPPFNAPDGTVRFAPATYTVLRQDPTSKALTPFLIQAWTANVSPVSYAPGDNAWLWALQAAKASIGLWGIWLGHVYHWHTVTAAMQMTMHKSLSATHPLWSLLRPQSQSLINFNYVLLTLLFGAISPPTPVDNYMTLLGLLDGFAKNRSFFDDDPLEELKVRKLDVKDFTKKQQSGKQRDWDAYPVVGYMLEIWDYTNQFVTVVVNETYKDDEAVRKDSELKDWMTTSGSSSGGNIKGLPDLQTRADLIKVLTSLLYRVNVHGGATLKPSVNPVLSFVANLPPCLQSADIPAKTVAPNLVDVLPHTWAIGAMTTFVFTFAYSPPYASLLPGGAVNVDPWFPPAQPKSNAALVTFREQIRGFIDEYTTDWNEALARLRGLPAGPIPAYATDQYSQWPSSIEI